MGAIPGLQVFPNRHALMAAAADRIAASLRLACDDRGAACAALSGGTTPGPAYALLAAKDLDWPRVTFLLVDERCVPPGHPASNEAMLRRELAPALAAGARLAPMYAASGGPSQAAAAADRVYAGVRIDIAVMGMGADGHTASWFPGAEGLEAALDPATPETVVPIRAPAAFGAPDRLTLTRRAVAQAGEVLILITGADKRATLEQALSRTPRDAPVAALFQDGPPPATFWTP